MAETTPTPTTPTTKTSATSGDIYNILNEIVIRVETTGTSLGALKTNLSTLATDVGGIKMSLSTLTTDVGKIKDSLSTLATNSATIKTGVETIGNAFSNAEGKGSIPMNIGWMSQTLDLIKDEMGSADFSKIVDSLEKFNTIFVEGGLVHYIKMQGDLIKEVRALANTLLVISKLSNEAGLNKAQKSAETQTLQNDLIG